MCDCQMKYESIDDHQIRCKSCLLCGQIKCQPDTCKLTVYKRKCLECGLVYKEQFTDYDIIKPHKCQAVSFNCLRNKQSKVKNESTCTCRFVLQILCGLISVALNGISIYSLPLLQLEMFTPTYNYCWLAGALLVGLNAVLTVSFLTFKLKCIIVFWFLFEVTLQALAITCFILMKQ